MFFHTVATVYASRGTYATSVGRLCVRSLFRPFCHFPHGSSQNGSEETTKHHKFVLPDNWTEQVRTKADFTEYKGKVYLVRSKKDESDLLRTTGVLQDFQKREALGLDVEFMPYRGGVKVCLVQLACHDVAVLWRCGHLLNQLPPVLVSLLMDRNILKVGHACQQDACYLHRYCDINVHSIVDTYTWAKDMGCSHQSLRAMCALFLKLRLAKDMQTSNWDLEDLSERQIRYAATDAWVSLRVFEEMRRTAKMFSIPLTPMFESSETILEEITVNKREGRKRREKARKVRARELKECKSTTDKQELSEQSMVCETDSLGDMNVDSFAEEEFTDSVEETKLCRTEKNRRKRYRYKANKRLRKAKALAE